MDFIDWMFGSLVIVASALIYLEYRRLNRWIAQRKELSVEKENKKPYKKKTSIRTINKKKVLVRYGRPHYRKEK